ncbi:MAG: sigma-70 family RNA polymerase sigma factor [Lachnospiraceae bacterium]|nr:sigma-70 family RNA polymerase sigma factor [Lachnospiraceae bacterium]
MEEKIKVYGPRLFGLCMTLCKNKHDAWDLYQETWLRAYERQEQYDASGTYESWLTAICVNRYRDYLRRLKIAPFFDLFSSTEEKDMVFRDIPAEEKEDFSEVREAVNGLPEKFRDVVILFYFQDKDIRRTAEIIGIPEGTVKSRLMKARKLLKEVLQDEWNL